MKTLLYRSSFKTRIWFSIMLITLVAIVVTGTSSHYIASSLLEKKAAELGQMMIDKSAMALQEKLRKVRLSAVTFMISPPFEDILLSTSTDLQEGSYYSYFSLNKNIQTPLMQMKMIEPSIASVLVHTPGGEFYLNSAERRKENVFEDTDLFKQMKTNVVPYWSQSHEDSLFEGKTSVLSLLIEPISTVNRNEVQVVVNVKEESIKEYVETNVVGNSGHIMVLNAVGEPMMDQSSPLVPLVRDHEFLSLLNKGNKHFEFEFDKKLYLVNYATISFPDNWKVVYLQPKELLLKDIQYINWAMIIIIGLLIPFVFLLSQWVTNRLLLPLQKLQRLMSRAGDNDLSVRFESAYQDEVAQVGGRFNTMLEKIEVLILDVKAAEHQKRLSEMKALQSQINPHFLYNTLNTILWKTESRKQEDVKEMIISLSLLFRLGLNNGYELTTVRKEIEHVTQYLILQQQCYEELFEFRIDAEETDLMEHSSLKLLLQPLVENSILHGFTDGDFAGWIHIRIERQEQYIVYSVEDNGKGFDREVMMRSLEEEVVGGGFALQNVYRRLKLYYGDDARVELESTAYSRTIVRLYFPDNQ
ncbi:MAG: sensor histidine kinase [Gorillibacterium sp.]|nr:sensor histidine kinase [Gorillibacterium sp.]